MVKKSPVDISHLAALSSSDSEDEADVFQKVKKKPSESEVAVAAPVALKKKKAKKEKDVNTSLPSAPKVEESKVTEDIASKKKKKKKERGGDGEPGQSVQAAPKPLGKTKGSSETTASALSSADSHDDLKSTKTEQLASPVPKMKKKGKKERAVSDSSADNTPKSSESIKETPGPLTALSDSDSEDEFSEPKKGIAPVPVPPKKEIVAAPALSKKKKNKKEKVVSDSSKIITPTSLESVSEDVTPLTALSDSESENEPQKEIAPVPILPKKKKLKKERTTSESSASKAPKSVESNPSKPTALSDSESENELSEPQKAIAPVPVLPKKKKLKKERTTSESSASKAPKLEESNPSQPTALSDSESENELRESKKVIVPAPPSPKKKKNKKEKAGNESSTSKTPKSKSVESKNKEASQINALSSSESESELKKEPQKGVAPMPVSVKKKKVKKEKAVDIAALEPSLPSTANSVQAKSEEAPPAAKKKKKKVKEGKGSHSVVSESESISEKQSLVSPKSKLISNAADMNFTSSDVGSQESPTKRTVRDIIDTLESSSSSDEETHVPVMKSPKKSPKKVRKDSESKTLSSEISVADGRLQPTSNKLDSSPKKSKKKVKTDSKSKTEGVDASVVAHHVRSLDMSGSSPNKSKKRKHRRSMSEESLMSDKEELSKPRKADLKSVTIETPEIDSDEEVSAGEMIDPESGDILPAEFPVTPTKTQADPKSSSESGEEQEEEEGEEDEEEEAEEEEATSEEDVRTDAAKQLRYKAENFKEVASFKAPWLEELRSKDKELWLIKVPGGSDVSFLNGQSMTWDKKTVVNAENNENESFQSVWEISARSIPEKQGVNLTALVPSKKDKMFHSVGQIAGQITVTKGVKVPEYVMPQTGLKILPKMPQGLKRRHQPFGADAPLNATKDDGPHSKLAKKKKKDKKHKIEGGSTLDTSLKKKKKKEKH